MVTRQHIINKRNPFILASERVYTSFSLLAHGVRREAFKRKAVPQISSQDRCKNQSGYTCVLFIIRNSRKGVHPSVLAQMTGYDKQKLDKILHRLFTNGEIMIEAGGVYTRKIDGIS